MSPYLNQHATNPVDWYPWGEEAFNKARNENKLIFASIGYSTCHWCHVMERESFSREDVGALMNSTFVCIKIDREERPDLDSYFIDFATRTIGSAGWPLNVILTPDRIPVFAFTYLPRESRHGTMGLVETVSSIGEIWKNDPKNIYETSRRNADGGEMKKITTTYQASGDSINLAFSQLKRMYDPGFGGFGRGLKFPTPHYISFLSTYYELFHESEALLMAERTTAAIRMGGIYDHVGLGIHRYATDTGWKIPHFEKMLYDQASLIYALSQLVRSTGNDSYRKMIFEIVKFLKESMMSPDGGYYTAIDADCEGAEGRYYTWTANELRGILGDNFSDFAQVFSIGEDGNYMDEARGISTGRNILYLENDSSGTSRFIEQGMFWMTPRIRNSLVLLRAARSKRIPPLTDTKVCADLNGFLLFALSEAYFVTMDESIGSAASDLMKYLTSRLIQDGEVIHISYENGKKIDGFLSDYAFVALGLLSYSGAFPLDSRAELVEKIMEKTNSMLLRNMELIRRNGYSEFTGSIASQEDSAMPSAFSAYDRVMQTLKFYGKFLPDQLPVPDAVKKNMNEYPGYFAFRMETVLHESSTFSIKSRGFDAPRIESIRRMLKEVGFTGRIIFIEEGQHSDKFSLCNSNSCIMENADIDDILKRLSGTVL